MTQKRIHFHQSFKLEHVSNELKLSFGNKIQNLCQLHSEKNSTENSNMCDVELNEFKVERINDFKLDK